MDPNSGRRCDRVEIKNSRLQSSMWSDGAVLLKQAMLHYQKFKPEVFSRYLPSMLYDSALRTSGAEVLELRFPET